MRRIITVMALILALALLLPSCDDAEKGDAGYTHSTDSTTITYSQFTYIFSTICQNYLADAENMGIDPDVPLNAQKCTRGGETDKTWHQYILNTTSTGVRELLVKYEAAKELGLTLSAEDSKAIEQNFANLNSAAQKMGMSTDELAARNFGDGVTAEDIRTVMTIQALAKSAENKLKEGKEYTHERLEQECAENMGSYYKVDYRFYKISPKMTEGMSAEELLAAREKAKVEAQAMADASHDEASFISNLEAYLRDVEKIDDDRIKERIDMTLVEGYNYSQGTEFKSWIFERDAQGRPLRQVGDTTVIGGDGSSGFTVCIVIAPMYRDEYHFRNARHILISLDSMDSTNGLPDADAKSKAQSILAELELDGVTEDEFSAAAQKYSMDVSASEGGLCSDVYKGALLSEFDEWLFSNERKPNDYGIVKTMYGYHIVYYVGESEDIVWEKNAINNLLDNEYSDAMSSLAEKHPVTVNEYALNRIKVYTEK